MTFRGQCPRAGWPRRLYSGPFGFAPPAVPQGRATQNRFLYSVIFLATLHARMGKYPTDFVFCHLYPDRKHNCLEPAVFRTYLVVFRPWGASLDNNLFGRLLGTGSIHQHPCAADSGRSHRPG